MKRREPHDVAVTVLTRCGATVWLGPPQFSAKWLAYYRPLWLLKRLARRSLLGQFLEALGLLPRQYLRIAHFDADQIVLVAFQHHGVMVHAAREISRRMGYEIKVIQQFPPRRSPTLAA